MENSGKRTPIATFSLDFDLPTELAVCFIGRTERETEHRIGMFREYLAELLKRKRCWQYKENK